MKRFGWCKATRCDKENISNTPLGSFGDAKNLEHHVYTWKLNLPSPWPIQGIDSWGPEDRSICFLNFPVGAVWPEDPCIANLVSWPKNNQAVTIWKLVFFFQWEPVNTQSLLQINTGMPLSGHEPTNQLVPATPRLRQTVDRMIRSPREAVVPIASQQPPRVEMSRVCRQNSFQGGNRCSSSNLPRILIWPGNNFRHLFVEVA